MVRKNNFNLLNNNLVNSANKAILSLNNNKFFAGIMMIVLNIGSKFITVKFSKTQEAYLRNTLGRQMLIFAVAFMATKDIYISIVILFIFVILADFLFNDESNFCIIPEKYKREMKMLLDNDGDGKVSEEEVENAIKILKQARKNKDYKNRVENYTRFMDNKY